MGWRNWLGLPELEQKSASADTLDQILREVFGQANSKAGQAVNLRTALEVTTVLCCARVIAEGIAQVPWKLYQRETDGGRREARDHSLFRLLHRQPNAWQTSFEFRETIALHLVLAGDAFVWKNRRASGEILELIPYEPGCVTVTRNSDMTLDYDLTLRGGRRQRIPRNQMWHIRGPSWNGYLGLNAVNLARNAIGLALATEEFGSALFANGARPGGLLTTDQPLKPETAEQIRTSWQAAQEGTGNAMKTAILHSGLSYSALSYNAEEAQFNETQKRAAISICAALRVLPIMAMQNEGTMAYASVEQLLLAHLTHTLMPWFERIDQSAETNLLSMAEQREGFYTKLEAKGMMRGTAKDRAEFNQIMRQNGVITVNEWRESEDMDRSDDPTADHLRPAVNIYGPDNQPSGE
ncbi:phage portal protein [Sphingobium sp. MI1205]|uniref:phage portal protein n=1 Tax=Sphingobium sp. MI1205 TaxID=407020 RepID=UPI0007702CE5|nr:phage portal protein [Sphingobium sp. MI1205]AMK19340.1 phage portal protein, HK97 family [Sphingobium sp. MI1205]